MFAIRIKHARALNGSDPVEAPMTFQRLILELSEFWASRGQGSTNHGDADCVRFLQWALPHLGLRWRGYRRVRGQVCKRIDRRIQALTLSGLAAYEAYLSDHATEWATLENGLLT